MSATTKPAHDPKSKGRSGVTNGKTLFLSADGRSAMAKRFRDISYAHASDLGGSETLSQAQQSLIRRAATLSVQLEAFESDLAEGIDRDMAMYATLTNTLRRLLADLGLKRVTKQIDYREYLGHGQFSK